MSVWSQSRPLQDHDHCPIMAQPNPDQPLEFVSTVKNEAPSRMKPHPIHLTFGDYGSETPGSEPFFHDFSGIAAKGGSLWLVSDEGNTLDQLTLQADGSYGAHSRLNLPDYLDLPDDKAELDLESLALGDDSLWLLGSHAAVRRKIKRETRDPEAAIQTLSEVDQSRSRHILASLPLSEAGAGCWTPQAKTEGRKSGALVKIGRKRSKLVKQLRYDPHLGPFMSIPSKENGFDAEGLAVAGERLFVGLRGPVLRGWALILELSSEAPKDGRLNLRHLGSEGAFYLKHFLDLDGMGIRDLTLRGEDLIILAGPTMDLDGPFRLYRWPEALVNARPTLVERSRLERILDLPTVEGADRAEGLTLMDYAGETGFAIVHDKPAAVRRDPVAGHLNLDFYPLP